MKIRVGKLSRYPPQTHSDMLIDAHFTGSESEVSKARRLFAVNVTQHIGPSHDIPMVDGGLSLHSDGLLPRLRRPASGSAMQHVQGIYVVVE